MWSEPLIVFIIKIGREPCILEVKIAVIYK